MDIFKEERFNKKGTHWRKEGRKWLAGWLVEECRIDKGLVFCIQGGMKEEKRISLRGSCAPVLRWNEYKKNKGI